MKCRSHDTLEAIGVCTACGSAVCAECAEPEVAGVICRSCHAKRRREHRWEEIGEQVFGACGIIVLLIVAGWVGPGTLMFRLCLGLAGLLVISLSVALAGMICDVRRRKQRDAHAAGVAQAPTVVAMSVVRRPGQVPTGGPARDRSDDGIGAVVRRMLSWLPVALCAPVLGPLVAGALSGKRAGTATKAMTAALIVAGPMGLLLYAAGVLATKLLPLGGTPGLNGIALVVAYCWPLCLGAVAGGWLTQTKTTADPIRSAESGGRPAHARRDDIAGGAIRGAARTAGKRSLARRRSVPGAGSTA